MPLRLIEDVLSIVVGQRIILAHQIIRFVLGRP